MAGGEGQSATSGPEAAIRSPFVSLPGLVVDTGRLREVCDRYGVSRLDVFGSVSRGDLSPESDIDVLYEPTPGARLGREIQKLALELADLVGRPVRSASRNALHERVRDQVLAEARLLSTRERCC